MHRPTLAWTTPDEAAVADRVVASRQARALSCVTFPTCLSTGAALGTGSPELEQLWRVESRQLKPGEKLVVRKKGSGKVVGDRSLAYGTQETLHSALELNLAKEGNAVTRLRYGSHIERVAPVTDALVGGAPLSKGLIWSTAKPKPGEDAALTHNVRELACLYSLDGAYGRQVKCARWPPSELASGKPATQSR
jgi:hypothetical protein